MQLVKKHRNQAGDTIIEVLIVLSILGFAFGIATATMSKAVAQARNAQEHSQAMGMLASQVELLRQAITAGTALPTSGYFCLKPNSTPSPTFTNVDNADATNCVQKDYYHSSINLNGSSTAQQYYTLRVRWVGSSGQLGKQQEVFYYRMHELNNRGPTL